MQRKMVEILIRHFSDLRPNRFYARGRSDRAIPKSSAARLPRLIPCPGATSADLSLVHRIHCVAHVFKPELVLQGLVTLQIVGCGRFGIWTCPEIIPQSMDRHTTGRRRQTNRANRAAHRLKTWVRIVYSVCFTPQLRRLLVGGLQLEVDSGG